MPGLGTTVSISYFLPRLLLLLKSCWTVIKIFYIQINKLIIMKKSFFSEIKKNHKKTFYTFIYYEKKKT